jgi:uncharacterized protein YigA (DUF484 family)
VPERAHGKSAGRSAGAEGSGPKAARSNEPISAAAVAEFLKAHPDFLSENLELAEALTPAAANHGNGIVDLQRYLVDRLRQQIDELSSSNTALIAVGRANMVAQSRVHRAVLALLSASSFEHLIETVTTDLAMILDLDAVTLGVEQTTRDFPPARLGGLVQLRPGALESLIGRGRSVCFNGSGAEFDTLFGETAGLVESHALIRLSIDQTAPPAVLALGSRKPELFHDGQRTELLSFLARALERCIRAWLELPS